VAVVLTLVQTKQIKKMYINETIQKHSTNNTKHSKYKYAYYQYTHTHYETHTYTHTHTLQNKLKQPQYKLKHKQFRYPK